MDGPLLFTVIHPMLPFGGDFLVFLPLGLSRQFRSGFLTSVLDSIFHPAAVKLSPHTYEMVAVHRSRLDARDSTHIQSIVVREAVVKTETRPREEGDCGGLFRDILFQVTRMIPLRMCWTSRGLPEIEVSSYSPLSPPQPNLPSGCSMMINLYSLFCRSEYSC